MNFKKDEAIQLAKDILVEAEQKRLDMAQAEANIDLLDQSLTEDDDPYTGTYYRECDVCEVNIESSMYKEHAKFCQKQKEKWVDIANNTITKNLVKGLTNLYEKMLNNTVSMPEDISNIINENFSDMYSLIGEHTIPGCSFYWEVIVEFTKGNKQDLPLCCCLEVGHSGQHESGASYNLGNGKKKFYCSNELDSMTSSN